MNMHALPMFCPFCESGLIDMYWLDDREHRGFCNNCGVNFSVKVYPV